MAGYGRALQSAGGDPIKREIAWCRLGFYAHLDDLITAGRDALITKYGVSEGELDEWQSKYDMLIAARDQYMRQLSKIEIT